MKIRNSKNYKFTNALHLQFVLEVLRIILEFDQIMVKIINLFNVFKVCVDQENSFYKIVRKSHFSKMKAESDKARDAVIIAIKHLLKASIRHSDKEIREAAQRLQIVFNTYDKPVLLINLQYDAETAAINNLLQELNTKYVSDMQKTGIMTWVEELQIKNNEFDNLVQSYHKEASGISDLHLIDLRKETDKAYQEMITFINALALVDKEISYDQLVTELNTLIKHYADTVAKHLGRIQDGKDNEEEDNKDDEKDDGNVNE
jgi:hypothetical protein